MRVIKFRGKRIDNGEWVYGDYSRYSKEKSIIMVDLLEQEDYWVPSETVGQYTGLKDKNGVEIYEGDILSVSHDFTETYSRGSIEDGTLEVWDEVMDTIGEIAPVVIEKGCATVAEWYLDTFSADDIEIIGNVFDSGDLHDC